MSGDSFSTNLAAPIVANKVGLNKDVSDYAGDISVSQTWAMLNDDANAVLVDVRSSAEWSYVGVPDLAVLGRETIFVAWQEFPGMVLNPGFVDEIKARRVSSDAPLFMLCRSGVRSKAAAIVLTAAGFGPCYNVAGGFEGDADTAKHRGLTGGWKAAGLPWVQS